MKKNNKDINNLKLFIYFMLFFLMINIFIFGFYNINNTKPYTIQDNCLSCNKIYGLNSSYYTSDYLEMLNKVQEDCGSTHFVYRDFELPLNENEQEWRVFTNNCKNNYCKTIYVKLEDCLK